jgi:hypothetical protein
VLRVGGAGDWFGDFLGGQGKAVPSILSTSARARRRAARPRPARTSPSSLSPTPFARRREGRAPLCAAQVGQPKRSFPPTTGEPQTRPPCLRALLAAPAPSCACTRREMGGEDILTIPSGRCQCPAPLPARVQRRKPEHHQLGWVVAPSRPIPLPPPARPPVWLATAPRGERPHRGTIQCGRPAKSRQEQTVFRLAK